MKKAFFLAICTLFLIAPAYAELKATPGDLVTRGTGKDLLTAPPKKKNAPPAAEQAAELKKTVPAPSLKPKYAISLYIGRCAQAKTAVDDIKSFAESRKDVSLEYYLMQADGVLRDNEKTFQGIELSLTTDAEEFEINVVPTYIIKTHGPAVYKVAGEVDLAQILKAIEGGTVKGEAKGRYVDLGIKGDTCKANADYARAIRPTREGIAKVNSEVTPLAPGQILKSLKPVSLEMRDEPVIIEKTYEFTKYSPMREFIVFPNERKEWAKERFKSGLVGGCCTNCTDLRDLWPRAQPCTKDFLTQMGVSSVPAIIRLKEK